LGEMASGGVRGIGGSEGDGRIGMDEESAVSAGLRVGFGG